MPQENVRRRQTLRRAALAVLAAEGGRGLTHRSVDAAAGVPVGTAKNYFPTREDLLRAVAEECALAYGERAAEVPTAMHGPERERREALVQLLSALLADAVGVGRTRVLAYLELHAEAARRPWLAEVLDGISLGDFLGFSALAGAAGLPADEDRTRVLTLALHGCLPHLVANGTRTRAAAGLDEPESLVRALLGVVHPEHDWSAPAG
ncbi:TetR/AcrR family transcriptional regulator [Streptomyces sp. NPDC047046]|uniref:TetR/AcrR family transcriptional regulator n=1 Tax=Streptomyces sp. NPDC047046 TaxID=3155378 RepID=UPI0033FC3053